MIATAGPAAGADYAITLAPRTKGAFERLKLFAQGPAASTELYGQGTGSFDVPGDVPRTGAATFREVPVRFAVGGRNFEGRGTVRFVNGVFQGLDLAADGGGPLPSSLSVRGNAYAYDEDGQQVTGRVTAAPAVEVAIPEPATWAFLTIGMGFIGFTLRRPWREGAISRP